MGLHALRNIGFYFKDQPAKVTQWRDRFKDFDPARAAKILGLPVKDGTIEVTYFDCRYRLCCKDGVAEKWTGEEWTDNLFLNEALVVYHIFGDLKDDPVIAGEWCQEDTLDPVRIRSGNRMDPLLKQFADLFSKNKEAVFKNARAIGGKEIDQGDWGFEFRPLDYLPIRTVFWDADEDFPPQLQVFVDTHATDFMDYEAVDFVIADLLTKIQPK